MDPALVASLAGQKRRQAKKALDSAVKEVQDRHQREAENFAAKIRIEIAQLAESYANQQKAFAVKHKSDNTPLAERKKDLLTLKARHKFEEGEKEKLIEQNKVANASSILIISLMESPDPS